MDFKNFYSPMGTEARDDFARRCDTSRGHLQNVMYGLKSCATDLAVAIERESGFTVMRWDLRPLDWFRHWPELIGMKGAPKVPATTGAKPNPDLAHGVAKKKPQREQRDDRRDNGAEKRRSVDKPSNRNGR